jgi:hypothetical protein
MAWGNSRAFLRTHAQDRKEVTICMSSIDLTNEQVRRNFLRSQMKEGKGEFVVREKVVVFQGNDGSEYVAPESLVSELGFKLEDLKVVKTEVKPAEKSVAKPVAPADEEDSEEEIDEEKSEADEDEESKPKRGRGRK